MKIVLNTNTHNMGSQVCIYDLQKRLSDAGVDAVLNDWDNYDRYDVAVFMGYDHDMARARKRNPDIRIGLADSKLSRLEWVEAARSADFLMVSSLEQRDTFLALNRNILVHFMFPIMERREKRHVKKDNLVIGYHGNKVHLDAMQGDVQEALNTFGTDRSAEFLAMYDVDGLKQAVAGIPDPEIMPTHHVQWSWDNYYQDLARSDIGIVPNQLPLRDCAGALINTAFKGRALNYESVDYLIRFKLSSNPGRIYVFAKLGIPVIADYTPSSSQFIEDGISGFIVGTPEAWVEALDILAESPAKRGYMASALREKMESAFDRQISSFLEICRLPLKKPPIDRVMIRLLRKTQQFKKFGAIDRRDSRNSFCLFEKFSRWLKRS